MLKRAAACLLAFAAVACSKPGDQAGPPPASPPAAKVAWEASIGPVFGFATVRRGAAEERLLCLGANGESRWLDAAGGATPGLTLPPRTSHLAAVDLDGDEVDEILAATAELSAEQPVAGLVALDLSGHERWRCAFAAAAPILGLASARAGEEVLIAVAAQAPLGVIGVSPEGAVAWGDETIRSALAVAIQPSGSGLQVACADDSSLLHRYTAGGEKLGVRRLPLASTELLAIDPQRLVSVGIVTGKHETMTQMIDRDGKVGWEIESGRRLEAAQIPAAVGVFAPDARVAVVSAAGDIVLASENGRIGAAPTVAPPIFCLGAGPRQGDRQLILVGTSRGVTALVR